MGVVGNGRDGAGGSPWLSTLNVLAGGVFVAAGFMHLLPDAEEGLVALSTEWKFQVRCVRASDSHVCVPCGSDGARDVCVWGGCRSICAGRQPV